MKTKLLIAFGKALCFFGKLLGRGSSLPGKILLKFDPQFLSKLTIPGDVIAVTGSSGKGSTTKMIASILRKNGYTVAHNESGSNLDAGILTMLLQYANFKGIVKADYFVLEIDERYTKYVFPQIHPKYVVITNITRDQPPRQGHFDQVFREIEKALDSNMHLILNADDPYLQKFENHGCQITYYGIGKNKYETKEPKFENLNITHCPVCHKKLHYQSYLFETLGHYDCYCKQFSRPKPTYEVTKLNFEKEKMTINQKYDLIVKPGLLYQTYNLLAAFSILSMLLHQEKKITEQMNEITQQTKVENIFALGKRTVHILNNKNENSTTFNQSIFYTTRFKGQKTIVIGWKEISRRYQYNDVSWLYDISFEQLNDKNLEKIVCIGVNRYDIAVRMKYAGIEEKKIITFETIEEATPYLKKKTKGDLFAILNFDYVKPLSNALKGSDEE